MVYASGTLTTNIEKDLKHRSAGHKANAIDPNRGGVIKIRETPARQLSYVTYGPYTAKAEYSGPVLQIDLAKAGELVAGIGFIRPEGENEYFTVYEDAKLWNGHKGRIVASDTVGISNIRPDKTVLDFRGVTQTTPGYPIVGVLEELLEMPKITRVAEDEYASLADMRSKALGYNAIIRTAGDRRQRNLIILN